MTINITPLSVGAMACLAGWALLAQPAKADCWFIFCTLDTHGTGATNEFRACLPQHSRIEIVYPKDEFISTDTGSAQVAYQVHVSPGASICGEIGWNASGWKVDIVFRRRSDGKTVAPARGILNLGGRVAGSIVLEEGIWDMDTHLFEPEYGQQEAHATVTVQGVKQWPGPAASKGPVNKKMLEFQPSPQSKTVKKTVLEGGPAPQGKVVRNKVSGVPNKAINMKITAKQTMPVAKAVRSKGGSPQTTNPPR